MVSKLNWPIPPSLESAWYSLKRVVDYYHQYLFVRLESFDFLSNCSLNDRNKDVWRCVVLFSAKNKDDHCFVSKRFMI